ncbi:LPS biosynthesis protein [Sinanaerobacter chloroacetimidivorans]|uniref:LPS biosynthesis protein n=1 Tax=Sinanaerobacter chloroacetimidivorans TaxID=2818044 RepID=A0A8J8B0H6_9FIRM|nr:LPS biosynthesis protein [Sinanaerobacter chloroacetimidivorans]MBR0597189.1 LPS biosynthesis protein [Sinanaerobacter chloroacetimidivorans]
MKIDNNEMAKKQQELDSQGFKQEARQMRFEFLRQVKESGIDHCPCKEACPHHGNCYECVTIHRGHQDHLPFCFWDMINEKLYGMSRMTEGSIKDYTPSCSNSSEEKI